MHSFSTTSLRLCCALGSAAAVLAAATTAPAAPITLTFNGGGGATPPVALSGYQLDLNAGVYQPNGLAGNGLYANGGGAETKLTRADGGAFNFSSIKMYSGSDPNLNLTFTGTLVGGGTVTSTFNSPSSNVGVADTLPASFANLIAVKWNQGFAGNNSYAFNNLVVDSVPEPTTAALLGTGALGLGLARRRRA